MRILLLTQYFWPETFPINTLVEHLAGEGAQVAVLTGQPNYPGGEVFPGYHAADVRTQRFAGCTAVFRVPIVPRGSASALRLTLNYLSFVFTASVLGPWLLRKREFDVIFVYAPSPILQAIPGVVMKRIKRAPLVTWVQDLWPESLESTGFVRHPVLLAAVRALVRWIYKNNDVLLGQSPQFVEAIRSITETTPVEYLPNPGPSGPSEPSEPAPIQFPEGFNVVFAGNMGTVQALDTIIDAAELLREDSDINILLVGSGSRSAFVAEECRRRGLTNLILAGRHQAKAMPAIFARADALMVTLQRSSVLSKTIPSKVQAYFAAGRPIIASLDGAGRDLVHASGAGLVSPANDAPALAANLRRLAAMPPETRDDLGRAARRYYDDHFAPALVARELLSRFSTIRQHRSDLSMAI